MKLSDLSPHPENPRKITDQKLKMLQKSLQEFGDLSGIIFNKKTNRLVGGHQRLKVLPPSSEIVMNTDTHGHVMIGGDRFTYRVVDWDETKEKAANIAANQHGGDFDLPKLSEWLLELDALNIDLDLTGFDSEELSDLMAPVNKLAPGCDEDEVPDSVEPKAKLGDLYELGGHRLLCGDSTNIQHVERLMGGEKANLWQSDPPYGVGYVDIANEKDRAKGYSKIANDDLQNEALKDFILSAINSSLPFMKDGFAFYMWHAMKMQSYFSQAAAAAAGILFHRQIIWVKPKFVFGRGHYHWRHELCLMGWLKGNEPKFYGERNQTTVWEIGGENDKIHPTQKPVAIWESPILNHTLQNEIVYEPFAGSGSQLIACEKTNRKCFMIEIEPHYVDVIIARFEKYSGKKAKLING